MLSTGIMVRASIAGLCVAAAAAIAALLQRDFDDTQAAALRRLADRARG